MKTVSVCKKLLTVLLAAALCAAVCACSEGSSSDSSQDAVSVASYGNIELSSSDWDDMTFAIDETEITLPCVLSELTALGFEVSDIFLDLGSADEYEIPAGCVLKEVIYLSSSDGSGNYLEVSLYNANDDDSCTLNEAYVYEISVSKGSYGLPYIQLPGNITWGASESEIFSAYGEEATITYGGSDSSSASTDTEEEILTTSYLYEGTDGNTLYLYVYTGDADSEGQSSGLVYVTCTANSAISGRTVYTPGEEETEDTAESE